MVDVGKTKYIYDDVSKFYEQKYVEGGWKNNPYMKDEHAAHKYWKSKNYQGTIVSLGVGSGQDIEILNSPDPLKFTGYDLSEGMLKNARNKFPSYQFIQHDCTKPIDTTADILVSMFGTPNYIGTDILLMHYKRMKCSHAFFVFYDKSYEDGLVNDYFVYEKWQLYYAFAEFDAEVLKLNENYYTVTW